MKKRVPKSVACYSEKMSLLFAVNASHCPAISTQRYVSCRNPLPSFILDWSAGTNTGVQRTSVEMLKDRYRSKIIE